jgi:hypothetical protein
MSYSQLVQLYFDRSNALQWYWTLYVIILGGLLAFSSLRQRKDLVTVALLSLLYAAFAYKNMGALLDVTNERFAILSTMREYRGTDADTTDTIKLRERLEPTLNPTDYDGVRNFHIACDVLTLLALWAMEWRRHRQPPTT